MWTPNKSIARRMLACLWLFFVVPAVAGDLEAPPTRTQVLQAMKKASTFMTDKVALRGGYVWLVSEDLQRRWGEIPARPSQIWLQGGTELMGQVFLDAWEATGDDFYLAAARRAADALVAGQHPLGGWHYFIDFDPAGIPAWYEKQASKFRYGYEEYRHYYGNATFDDRVTQDAGLFLLRFYRLSREAAYREPALEALAFLLESQYPNGAWPQRFPLRFEFAHDGLPDYTSFYTLNDGAMQGIVELLLEGYDVLGDARYFESARLGLDALIAMQGPEGQAAWGEQHGPDLRPIAARTHEPAGYVIRESTMAMQMLLNFYLRTGDRRYLAPVPRCLEWLERINRESAAQKYPAPRYWAPGSNQPLYVVRTGAFNAEGYGLYKWTTDVAQTRCGDAPCRGDGRPLVDVSGLRKRYQEIAALGDAQSRAARLAQVRARPVRAPRLTESAADVIEALDSRGAWVTGDNSMPVPNASTDAAERETVRGISTRTFVQRMEILIGALGPGKPRQAAPYTIADGLFDASRADLGLRKAEGTQTATIFRPGESGDQFSNGVVLMPFKGRLYAQWQQSARDEDSGDTWVAYATSDDGLSWSKPRTLAKAGSGGRMHSSGGWWADGQTLVAYVNVWPTGFQSGDGGHTEYLLSTDGRKWSKPKRVTAKDGTAVDGIIEQDPHALRSGRIVTAFHLRPGMIVAPWYTDDPRGISGWVRGQFDNLAHEGRVSRELEPSWFARGDCLVMVFRDQAESFRQLASESCDGAANWTTAVLTGMPDARAKQSAGNLPGGSAYLVNAPNTGKSRIPLAIT